MKYIGALFAVAAIISAIVWIISDIQLLSMF